MAGNVVAVVLNASLTKYVQCFFFVKKSFADTFTPVPSNGEDCDNYKGRGHTRLDFATCNAQTFQMNLAYLCHVCTAVPAIEV